MEMEKIAKGIFIICKGKGKIIPVLSNEHHAMKAYWRSRSIAPRIL
jgi:hypothetical protein